MTTSVPRYDPSADVEPDVSSIVTEDDAPVDNLYSEKQQRLLTQTLYASWSGPPPEAGGEARPFLATANVGLFATPKQPPLVPDVMVSLDVRPHPDIWEKKHRSYFVWEFGKAPEVVIEVVSNREGDELGAKRSGYRKMRVAHYVVWDPERVISETPLQSFELRGSFYNAMKATFFPDLNLGLTVWKGTFEDVDAEWLRWCDADGVLLPTGEERAEAERTRAEAEHTRAEAEHTRAEAERTRAEAEHTRAERLAAKLRALGIDPDAT